MNSAPGTIDDLTRPFPETTIGTQWQMLSDAVMGGVSAGRMTRTVLAGRPALRREGDVSLENHGGFIQSAVGLAPNGATPRRRRAFSPREPTARASLPAPCGRR